MCDTSHTEMGWTEEQLLERLRTPTSWTHEAVEEVDKKGETDAARDSLDKKGEATTASETLEARDEAIAKSGCSDGRATGVVGEDSDHHMAFAMPTTAKCVTQGFDIESVAAWQPSHTIICADCLQPCKGEL